MWSFQAFSILTKIICSQVIGLSADACGKASQLLSQVQHLTEQIPDAAVAAELDNRGARAADAAQALLTIAQVENTVHRNNCGGVYLVNVLVFL